MVSDLKHIVDLAETEFARRDRRSEFVRNPAAWVEYKLGYQLWSKQREMLESLVDNRTTLVAAGHGVSKPLVRTEKIRTTAGWSTIGELKIGDRVYDEQGMPTMVVGKSQVWEQECYEIEFSDGTKIISAKGHEWNVLDLSKRTAAMKRGVSDWREHWDDTKTMQIEDLFAAGVKTQSGQNRWRIPTARPLQTPSVDLPINPYLFGFWIADGSSSGGQITIGAKKAGLLDWLTQNGYEYTSNWNPDRNRYTVGIRGLRTSLRELGVLGDKRVPDAYVWASEHQRREFLAGFLDGDGWVAPNSALVQVSQTKKHITDAVDEILLSLGYVTHRNEQVAQYKLDGEYTVTGTAYKVGFTPDVNPFKVRNEGWSRTTQQSRQTQRTIVAIRKVETVPTQCIEVDSKRHLFLAGRNLVPTHNSFTAAMVVCWWMDTHPIQETFVATTAPSASQLNVVWDYVRTFHQQAQARYESGQIDAPLPGYVTGDNKWKVDGVIRGEGRKPPDRPQADAFQGRHAKYLLGLVDEAVGVPEPLINGIFHIATAEYNRVMMIANPTNPSSAMGKLWQKCDNEPAAMKDYHRITISAAMSPLIVPEPGFDMERAKGLSGPEFLVQALSQYGSVDDPRYRARVLGEWSYDEGNTVFTQEELARARDCIVRPYPTQNREIGVDIARMGQDSSQVYLKEVGEVWETDDAGKPVRGTGVEGVRLRHVGEWRKAPLVGNNELNPGSAQRVHKIAVEEIIPVVKVDASGIGSGVIDGLAQLNEENDYVVIEVFGGAPATDNRAYRNMRAEQFFEMKTAMLRGELDLDNDDSQLFEELESLLFEYSGDGVIKIESKEDIRRAGRESPDRADTAWYAFLNVDEILSAEGLAVGDKFTRAADELFPDLALEYGDFGYPM